MTSTSNKYFCLYLLLAVASLTTAILLWKEAFPTASLNFNVGQSDAKVKMEDWISKRGFDLHDYKSAVEFEESDESKNFIELTQGLPALEQYVERGLSLWSWAGRWFRPEHEEEFSAAVDTEGRLIAFNHTIEEKRKLPSLSEADARILAENFLRSEIKKHPFDQLKFIESSTSQRTNRTDYNFSWERKDLKIGDASYRIAVSIQGNEIGGYAEYLKVPEAWSRDFEKKRKTNDLFYYIAKYLSLPLLIATIVLLVLFLYRRQFNKHSFPYPWVLFLFVVNLLSYVNEIPSATIQCPTTDKWGVFVLTLISDMIIRVIGSTLQLWLLVLIADPLYRRMLPEHVPFSVFFHSKGLRYRQTLRSIGLGVVFACVSFGYVCVFYSVGKNWGIWSPVEIDYSKTLTGLFPWANGIEVGMSAALLEEMFFRVIAILIYWRITKSKWFAIIMAAVSWAFLHSNYPQMPGYIRGVELTFEGVLWGALMLRYGVLTTLVAHYLFDCGLTSLIVIQSPNWADRIGAFIAFIWPMAFGIYGYLKYGATEEYRPEAAPAEPPSSKPAFHWWESPMQLWNDAHQSTVLKNRWFYAIAGIVIFVSASMITLPSDVMNDQLGEIDLSRSQIKKKADEYLKKQGADPATWIQVVSLSAKSTDADYYIKNGGTLEGLTKLYGKEWPDLAWDVRYFRFLEKEEYRFQFDKHGGIYSSQHIIPQESPGPSLTKEEALKRTNDILKKTYGVDLTKEKLVEDSMDKQPERTDYHFSFDRTDWNIGESKLRTDATLQGEELVGLDRYIKPPEEWIRERSATTWKDALAGIINSWTYIGSRIILGLLCVLMIRKNILPWKAAFLLAVIPLLLQVISHLNDSYVFYQYYSTLRPQLYYVGTRLGNLLQSDLLTYLTTGLKICVAMGLMNWAFGWKYENLVLWPKNHYARGELWLNSFITAVFAMSLFGVLSFLENGINGHFVPWKAATFDYPHADTVFPWVEVFVSAFQSGYSNIITRAMTIAGLVILYRKIPKLVIVAVFVIPLLDAINERSLREFVISAIFKELNWLLTLALIWRLWRFNVLAIFLYTTLFELSGEASVFITKGGPYKLQAAPLILICLIPLFVWLHSYYRYRQNPNDEPAVS